MELTPAELKNLKSLHFQHREFEELQAGLKLKNLPDNQLDEQPLPPPEGSILAVPEGAEEGSLRRHGQAAIDAGQAALVLLNGGMATRFGGRVKGVVDALPGRSFLALQLARLATTGCPLVLMNSQATDSVTRSHLEENRFFGMDPTAVISFQQSAAPRLTPAGDLYRDQQGALSLYGPGHGDLLPSLRRSGALASLQRRGVKFLLVANVDNLGAELSAPLLGLFQKTGSQMMAEVCSKAPGEVGGSPAMVAGKVRIVEGFAFPPTFDQDSLPVFNTNTLWFRCDALEEALPLRWYQVHKRVNGEQVVQFERLVGQASWFLDSSYVKVPRRRFCPIKSPEDLSAAQTQLRALFDGSKTQESG